MRRNVYSVGQVNAYIKNMFAQDFMLRQISVSGEISNCKYHSSGHIYFTLKDSSGIIQAVMFAGNRRGLTFHMKEGDNVVVTGSIEVYERDGKYQLYAREITLAGAGDLYLKYEALKKELEEMGMFAKEYKQDIPNQRDIVTQLKECADIINTTDEKMRTLRHQIEKAADIKTEDDILFEKLSKLDIAID